MPSRKLIQTTIVLALLLVVAACTPGAGPPTATSAPPRDAEVSPATQAPAASDAPAATPTEAQPAVQPTEAGELPLGDPSLKASDPTAVNLAAGHPQLVEFFAFW